MSAAVFAYTRRGLDTAGRALSALPAAEGYAPARIAAGQFAPIPQDSGAFYGELFRGRDALVFVGAAGIAVRCVAPFVGSKDTDPAVVCIDELGRYVIPLLSGHIGGANALAEELAAALGAVPIVTTATDGRRRFSVDRWAAEHGYVIDDLRAAKAVSAAILEGDVPLCCGLPVAGELPPGLKYGDSGALGVYIGWEVRRPFDLTLRLIPRALRLGLGCRRGIHAEAVRAAVETAFADAGLDMRAIARAASVDLKKDEQGLLDCCALMGWPLDFYTPERLRAVAGDFTPSDFVRSVTGVDNVCERAALLGAETLILKKTAALGVTVAAAAEKTEVRFD